MGGCADTQAGRLAGWLAGWLLALVGWLAAPVGDGQTRGGFKYPSEGGRDRVPPPRLNG